jgi:hypothetical protein
MGFPVRASAHATQTGENAMSGLKINHEWTRMDTNTEKLLLKEEAFQVVGCAIEILNTLGHGLVEKPYENALVIEFLLRKIPFKQQPS